MVPFELLLVGIAIFLQVGSAGGQIAENSSVTVTSVALGAKHTCALLSPEQRVKCWGTSAHGALNTDRIIDGECLPFVNLGSNAKVGAIVTSTGELGSFTCAILTDGEKTTTDGSVKCWGNNMDGQLGIGSSDPFVGLSEAEMGDNLAAVNLGTGRKAVSVCVGVHHSCAVLDNAAIKCWGVNEEGQLGQGDRVDRGASANDMGDNLPQVNLGTGARALEVTCGKDFTCALLESGAVKCWGANTHGQLGMGDVLSRGWVPSDLGDNLPSLDLGGRAAGLAAGDHHACARLEGGDLKCWGANGAGQLGRGDSAHYGGAPWHMGANLTAAVGGVKQVVAGREHTCALLQQLPGIVASVKCWGRRTPALGLPAEGNVGDGPGEMAALGSLDLGDVPAEVRGVRKNDQSICLSRTGPRWSGLVGRP